MQNVPLNVHHQRKENTPSDICIISQTVKFVFDNSYFIHI